MASLRAADASLLEVLKSGEQEKQKTYSAVVWLPRPLRDADLELLESTAELMVQQQTPIRVRARAGKGACDPHSCRDWQACKHADGEALLLQKSSASLHLPAA